MPQTDRSGADTTNTAAARPPGSPAGSLARPQNLLSNYRQIRLRTQSRTVPRQSTRCHQTVPLVHLLQGAAAVPAVPLRTWQGLAVPATIRSPRSPRPHRTNRRACPVFPLLCLPAACWDRLRVLRRTEKLRSGGVRRLKRWGRCRCRCQGWRPAGRPRTGRWRPCQRSRQRALQHSPLTAFTVGAALL